MFMLMPNYAANLLQITQTITSMTTSLQLELSCRILCRKVDQKNAAQIKLVFLKFSGFGKNDQGSCCPNIFLALSFDEHSQRNIDILQWHNWLYKSDVGHSTKFACLCKLFVHIGRNIGSNRKWNYSHCR